MRANEFITSEAMVHNPIKAVPRKLEFSASDLSAIERLIPAARGKNYQETLDFGKELLEKLLTKIKDGETLSRQEMLVIGGLYDILRKQTNRYDSFMRQHNLAEDSPFSVGTRAGLSYFGDKCTKDCSGHRAGREWAIRKGISSPNQMPEGGSNSFWEGGATYARGKSLKQNKKLRK